MSAKTDPAAFADTEIIKSRLDELAAKLDELIGRLEALQASIDGIDTFLGGWRPKRPMQTGPSTPIDGGAT